MESLRAGDYAEAFCLWRPLAMQGDSEAAYYLGWLYANGNGLRVDISKAVYWWKQSAASGHRDAMFALALAFTDGEGIGKDKEKAIDWYLRSAVRGHEDAREIVKAKLRNGERVILNRLNELLTEPWLGDRVAVARERVNLRSGPSVDRAVVKQVYMGQSLIAIDRRGDWYWIVDPEDSSLGWIAAWLTEPNQ
ncbi:MAG: SH3 domain-containing protein [Candidatus Thiodiazotropha sp.]